MLSVIHHRTHGGIAGRSTHDAVAALLILIERAFAGDFAIAAAFEDARKCFDLLERVLLIPLASELGFPIRIQGWPESSNRDITRYIGIGESAGEMWSPSNGVTQGCALSLTLISMVMSTWARVFDTSAIKHEINE